MCTYLKLLLLIAFMLGGVVLNAQEAKMVRAQTLYNEKKPDQAKLCIDSVVIHPETKGRFEAWTLRGYIYFEIYKRTDKIKFKSPLRDTIVASIKRSNKLKPDADYLSNNKKLLINISGHYYKLEGMYLQDSSNYEMSLKSFEKFKELTRLADSTANLKDKDMEFYLAAGSHFSQEFNLNKKNIKAFEIAKVALMTALEISPNDTSANMNMGLMYLNQSTDLIERVDGGEVSISELDVLLENSIKLAKQAEQFILKVYNQNNKSRKAVLALYYVYRVLNEPEKKALFESKCKEMKIEVTDESSKQKK